MPEPTQRRRRRRKPEQEATPPPKRKRTRSQQPSATESGPEDKEVVRLAKLIQGYEDRVKNPLTGIRAFCVGCMGGYLELVNKCPSTKCPLWAFRTGKNTLSARFGRANPNAFGKKGGEDDEEPSE